MTNSVSPFAVTIRSRSCGIFRDIWNSMEQYCMTIFYWYGFISYVTYSNRVPQFTLRVRPMLRALMLLLLSLSALLSPQLGFAQRIVGSGGDIVECPDQP